MSLSVYHFPFAPEKIEQQRDTDGKKEAGAEAVSGRGVRKMEREREKDCEQEEV